MSAGEGRLAYHPFDAPFEPREAPLPQLLVFVRAPVPGTVKTRLAARLGEEGAHRVYAAFLSDLAAELAGLGPIDVAWLVAGPPDVLAEAVGPGWRVVPQAEGDLGERMASAFRAAFERAAGPVAVAGSDSPLLSAADLAALLAAVQGPVDAAVIPAEDGGYVALALGAPCDEAFRGIPWSTAGVFDATRRALEGAGRRVRVLSARSDVDEVSDLGPLAAALAEAPERAPATRGALASLGLDPAGAIVDALGRRVPLDPVPRRIVSLVPSVTECLFDAGLGGRVVGRTDYCVSPAEAVAVASVGGPKSVDVGHLLALEPDLVLANAEENDRGQVEALVAAGLRVHVAFPRTLPRATAFLRDLGRLAAAPEPLEGMARALEALGPAPEPAVPCACLIWKAPYMTASGDTLTSALVEAAGGRNVFASRAERYPVLEGAELGASGARVVLLPTEPYAFDEADAREVERLAPGAAALSIPGEWVTWYGSRMVEAVNGLRRALSPFRSRESATTDHGPRTTDYGPPP